MALLERLKSLWGNPEQTGCKHEWQVEEPTFQIGNSFKQWDGPIHDYCTKCGQIRLHPECRHQYKRVKDDGSGPMVNGKRMMLVSICSKCGSKLYKSAK